MKSLKPVTQQLRMPLLAALLFCGGHLHAQVTKVEYFIDVDPGFGQAVNIPVSSQNDISQAASINLSQVVNGFHNLFIRSKDAAGNWSISNQSSFFKISGIAAPGITRVEYFFDTDPGFGQATAIAGGSGQDISNQAATINLSQVSLGFHNLYIRSRDAAGKWSIASQVPFFKSSSFVSAQILKAEYFFDTDPGFGLATDLPVVATSNITDSLVDISLPTLALGRHNLFIRTRDAQGKWSITSQKSFLKCNTNPSISRFNFHIEGNRAFFTNLSEYSNSRLWQFGDGTSSTVLNPIKIYSAAGNYVVSLISTNSCNTDTLTTMFTVRGIQRINATKGGNNGVATVIFEGAGFTPATILKLQKGNAILLPGDKQFISPNRIIAYFNLAGADPGKYNVVANISNSPLDTLKNGFEVQSGTAAEVYIAGVSGRNPQRSGQHERSFTLQNKGNEDAIMLPFVMAIGYIPGSVNPQFVPVESMAILNNDGIFQNTFQYLSLNGITSDVMSPADIDTGRRRQLFSVYRVKVPSETRVSNRVKLANTNQSPFAFSDGALVHPPLFSSGLVLNNLQSPFRDCLNSFLKKAVKKNITTNINNTAWDDCFNNAFDTLTKTIRDISRDISRQDQYIPVKAIYSTLLASMSQCSSSGMPSSINSVTFDQTVKDFMYNWFFLENIDSIGRPCFDTTETVILKNTSPKTNTKSVRAANRAATNECPGAVFFPELAEQCEPFTEACGKFDQLGSADNVLAVTIGKKIFEKLLEPFDKFCKVNSASIFCEKLCELSSLDPNAKYGPGDNAGNPYINNVLNTGYSIFFENLATATAPAAYVEITDTLDKTRFDLSTFQAGNFGWGDSIVQVDANLGDYSLLKDLQPARPNYLRMDVRLDTATGIVNWKFSTLDLVTLQLTNNPAEGFLPPNIDGKIGQGFVTFTVRPTNGVTSGTVINNKAVIVFDQNPPINTGNWQHIIDTTKPQSAVAPLPTNVTTEDFVVNWSGADAHAGVDKYTVYVSVNDSLYTQWNPFTAATSDTFHGRFGNTYKFFSTAIDRAGNYEGAPEGQSPDAVTTPLIPGQVVSVQNGLWSQPATWSNNQVPGDVTDVLVKHQVAVDINASCKSLRAVSPGLVQVNSGQRLDIKGQ